jgi:hypothetical protein
LSARRIRQSLRSLLLLGTLLCGDAFGGKMCYVGKACGGNCIAEYLVCTQERAAPKIDGAAVGMAARPDLQAFKEDVRDTAEANEDISAESVIDPGEQTQHEGLYERNTSHYAHSMDANPRAVMAARQRRAMALMGGSGPASAMMKASHGKSSGCRSLFGGCGGQMSHRASSMGFAAGTSATGLKMAGEMAGGCSHASRSDEGHGSGRHGSLEARHKSSSMFACAK